MEAVSQTAVNVRPVSLSVELIRDWMETAALASYIGPSDVANVLDKHQLHDVRIMIS